MAEAVAIGALSVAASVASNWMEPTTFPARHEESHRKEMDRLQKNTDHWYKGISDQEVNSDEELEFQKLQREARKKGKEYRDSIQDYKDTSVLNPMKKIKKRREVRKRKKEASRSVHSLEDIVQEVSDRSQSGSRASSRAASSSSLDSESIIASSGSPPEGGLHNEGVEEWCQDISTDSLDDEEKNERIVRAVSEWKAGTDGVRNEGNNIYYEVSDEEEDKFSIVDLSLEDAVPSVAAGQAGKMAKEMTASNIQPPSVPTPWGPYNAPPMTTPYNLPPTTNPYNVPPTMNPYNVPPTTNPYNVPPTTNPYNVPPTTNPYNVPTPKAGPYNVPTPRAGPYNVPTPRGPYNLPTPRGPNDGPTSVNPLGMSWGVPNLTGPYGGPSIGPWGVPPWTVPTSMDPYGGPTSIGPYGQTSMGTVLKPNEMAHVDKFAAGTHYGPVLEPFLTHVLWVVPKLNPLIMSVHFEAGEPQHEYLRWNMLWAPDTVHRSSDPPQTSWLVGRYSPATFPRIASMRLLSSILHPFTIEIFAQDPDIGVTCEDLIDGIFRFMRKHSSKADFHNLSTSRKRIVLKSYKYNRSLVRRQLGEALGEGLQRMDFLGEETMFGGIREDPIAVMRLCGQVLPCTWILDCMTEYAAEEH